jgi:hypothetical protein
VIWLTCYTALRPETEAALHEHVPPGDAVRLIDVSGDDYAYGRHLQEMWAHCVDWVNVEHDVVITADVARAFHECPNLYCAFPYEWQTTVGVALGCTRFRSVFTAKYPDAMREACATPSSWTGQPGYWRQLDVFLQRRILRDKHGEQPCGHLPPVEHLNPKQALRADASPVPVLTVEGF